jgi:hypothetical protein
MKESKENHRKKQKKNLLPYLPPLSVSLLYACVHRRRIVVLFCAHGASYRSILSFSCLSLQHVGNEKEQKHEICGVNVQKCFTVFAPEIYILSSLQRRNKFHSQTGQKKSRSKL